MGSSIHPLDNHQNFYLDRYTSKIPEVEPLLDNSPLATQYYQVIYLRSNLMEFRATIYESQFMSNQLFKVIVYTGAERNAGTSSDVTIRLIGNSGTTEPHILKSKRLDSNFYSKS